MHRTLLTLVIISLLSLTVPLAYGEEREADLARQLINSQGCRACHALEGNGGVIANSFEKMRKDLSRQEIRQQLVNPSQKHGRGTIPDFSHLSEPEIDSLVNFIKPES